MSRGFAELPDAGRYVLLNATVPAALIDGAAVDGDGLVRRDILIGDGRIERIRPPGGPAAGAPRLDLDGGMVWPCFADIHTHLDKGHIWPRRRNPDGTFLSARMAVAADREANWSAEDVARRMDFALRTAYAHGTTLIRTHLDSLGPQHRISWPVFSEMRDRWEGRIDIQAVGLMPLDALADEAYAADLAATIQAHRGVLGGVAYGMPGLAEQVDRLFRLAMAQGLDLDLHIDENGDPASNALRVVADTALRYRFEGAITCGHCCSLATQPADEANETLARVAEAGIAIVSLPMCNLYLQDRIAGRTPRWRGVTLLHEMRARGIPVAIASDNTRDPFYAYGDLDPVEVYREGTRILHLDHPVADAPALVARAPAAIVGRPDKGRLVEGGPADMVLFRARDWSEFLARPQADRTVLRAGRPIDRTLPDYRELDDIALPAMEDA